MAFKVKSYIVSRTADDKGINNFPGADVGENEKLTAEYIIGNLENLHNKCIQPIMNHFNTLPNSSGNSIGVTSVYRCKKLNAAVGGVENSQHIHGMAADLIYTEGKSEEVFNWALAKLPAFHQLIWEFPEKGEFSSGNLNSSWIHISYNQDNNPKIVSLASDVENLHEWYGKNVEGAERRGIYTHGIDKAEMEASDSFLTDDI